MNEFFKTVQCTRANCEGYDLCFECGGSGVKHIELENVIEADSLEKIRFTGFESVIDKLSLINHFKEEHFDKLNEIKNRILLSGEAQGYVKTLRRILKIERNARVEKIIYKIESKIKKEREVHIDIDQDNNICEIKNKSNLVFFSQNHSLENFNDWGRFRGTGFVDMTQLYFMGGINFDYSRIRILLTDKKKLVLDVNLFIKFLTFLKGKAYLVLNSRYSVTGENIPKKYYDNSFEETLYVRIYGLSDFYAFLILETELIKAVKEFSVELNRLNISGFRVCDIGTAEKITLDSKM